MSSLVEHYILHRLITIYIFEHTQPFILFGNNRASYVIAMQCVCDITITHDDVVYDAYIRTRYMDIV